MRRVPSEASAAERARWLAELGEALAEAQVLAWHLGLARGDPQAMELYGRFESAIAEVQSLRLGGRIAASAEDGPDWTEIIPWSLDRRRP